MWVAGRGQRVTLSSERRRGSDIRLAFVPRVALLVPISLKSGILGLGVSGHRDEGGP